MKTEQIPTVEAHDLQLMWRVREEFPTDKIDVAIAQPFATKGADLMAAGKRADLLRLLIRQAPDAFGLWLVGSQPTDHLFANFATTPLSDAFDLSEFLSRL